MRRLAAAQSSVNHRAGSLPTLCRRRNFGSMLAGATMELFTIPKLKRAALAGPVEARVHAQVDSILKKETNQQKPFWELVLADAESKITLRAWSDSPNFAQCAEL